MMQKNFRLTTVIQETTWLADAVGIILPIPVNTTHQALTGVELPGTWDWREISAKNAAQTAYLIQPCGATLSQPFSVDVTLGKYRAPTEHYDARLMTSLMPGNDAEQVIDDLPLDAQDTDYNIQLIAQYLSERFHYQHGVNLAQPLTSCSLTGNCLDINTAFIKLLKLAGVRVAYYIGYFFADGRPMVHDDWHCWVSTLSMKGDSDWDIAHHMTAESPRMEPALNPLPGIRFAMSTGRDLIFESPTGDIHTPHLCEPRWVLKNGLTRACRVLVTGMELAGVAHGS